MRSLRALATALAAALLASACAAGGGTAPAATAAARPAPVIERVVLRSETGRYEVVFPDFYFHDAAGNVRLIHRDIVATDANLGADSPIRVNPDGLVRIPSAQQRRTAVFTGGWHCGPGRYYVTIRAFMIDLEGGKSNTVQYTIHCNGG